MSTGVEGAASGRLDIGGKVAWNCFEKCFPRLIFFFFALKGLVVLVFNDNIIRICFICIFFGKWVFWDRVVYTQLGRSLIVPINIKKKGRGNGVLQTKTIWYQWDFSLQQGKAALRIQFCKRRKILPLWSGKNLCDIWVVNPRKANFVHWRSTFIKLGQIKYNHFNWN